MTAAASRLRVLLLLPGARNDADAAFAALAGASGAVEFERLADCTENGLRERLARADVQVLHFVGRGKIKAAAGYAVLELDASGGGTRTVNARHLAGLLAQQPALQLVVLQPSAPGEQLAGLETVLLQNGVRATLVTPPLATRAAGFASRLYGALAAGATVERACDAAREALVGDPAQSAAVRLAAARPEQVAPSRAPDASTSEARASNASAAAAPPPTVDASVGEQREREIQRTLAAQACRWEVRCLHVPQPAGTSQRSSRSPMH